MKQFIGEKLKNSKPFGILLIIISTFGLSCILYQMFGFDKFVRPYLFVLPEGILAKYPNAKPLFPAFTTNNVSGFNNIGYFTQLSNILTDLYILSLGLSIVGVKKIQKIGFNKYFAGAVTMFIAITGIVYCGMMLPFIDKAATSWVYEFPSLAMIDFLGYWHHICLPIIMLVLWYLPFSNEELDVKKFTKTATIFPIVYSVLTVVRGTCGALYPTDITGMLNAKTWWPYPFLAPDRISPYVENLLGHTNQSLDILFTIICYILVAVIMFVTPVLLAKIHNKYIKHLNQKYTFLENTIK